MRCFAAPLVVGAARALVALALVFPGAGCSKKKETPAEPPPVTRLEAALSPAALYEALRRAGGGRFQGTTTLRVSDPKQVKDETSRPDAVTTQTELTLDRHGNYRLVETNDQDGGREVIVHGKEIGVALRYGRMVRRPTSEAEVARLLEEALGGPQTAWDVVGRFAEVTAAPADQGGAADGGARELRLRLAKAAAARPAAAAVPAGPLQRWRGTTVVESLSGEARLDRATGALLALTLDARFGLSRDGTPLAGQISVQTRLAELGAVAVVAPPIADELRPRQRTILEERALLGRPGGAGSEPGAGSGKASPPASNKSQ